MKNYSLKNFTTRCFKWILEWPQLAIWTMQFGNPKHEFKLAFEAILAAAED
jgi:hypothetical protein